jgi:hypothetical protein
LLLPPRRVEAIPASLVTKILAALATRFDTTISNVRKYVDVDHIQKWGKVKCLDQGDTIVAASLTKAQSDRRDATFVRVGSSHIFLLQSF